MSKNIFIHDTVSLCSKCYRHVPAVVYEQAELIWISKLCPEHGIETALVEKDPEFYYSLEHNLDYTFFNQVLIEITDKCQLECPHCYHLPDNKSQDKPLELLKSQTDLLPVDSQICFAGAEPSLYKKLIPLIEHECTSGRKSPNILTNGVKFSNYNFAKECYNAGLKHICIGLNHYSYQGENVHKQQLEAIENLKSIGYIINYVGYTLETVEHLEDVLEEIDAITDDRVANFRIRCGSFIGRSGDQERSFLSSTYKKIKELNNGNLIDLKTDDNPYHVMTKLSNGASIRIIQWPDATNIDMEELATGPWCEFIEGPITNFVHQIICRDAFINNKLPQLDYCPEKYIYRTMTGHHPYYWKDSWNRSQSELINITEYLNSKSTKLTVNRSPFKILI